jgi:hypothetical protein
MSATDYLGHHPYVGACISLAHVGGAALLQVSDIEFPPIVMQLFQIGAWIAAIVAAIFTCYGVWKTHHGKRNRK